MPVSITTPTVGGSVGTWGTSLNAALAALAAWANAEEATRLANEATFQTATQVVAAISNASSTSQLNF
jgi:hypothetical protein